MQAVESGLGENLKVGSAQNGRGRGQKKDKILQKAAEGYVDRLSRARKKIKYYLWVLGILALGIIGYGLYGMLYMRKQEACVGK